jgi:hypothetical protein
MISISTIFIVLVHAASPCTQDRAPHAPLTLDPMPTDRATGGRVAAPCSRVWTVVTRPAASLSISGS